MKCVEILAAQEGFNLWNVMNMKGVTPIMMALREGRREIVNVLLNYAREGLTFEETLAAQRRFDDWNVPDETGRTPLYTALKHGQSNIVDIVMEMEILATGWM